MTNEEFIQSLSPKANSIIHNYQCQSRINSIKVILSNKSKMTCTDNDYIIFVNQNIPLAQMEYEFLHEFFHCVQKDCNFPNVHHKDISYQKLSSVISSTVLDLDVVQRLKNSGYPYIIDKDILRENIKTTTILSLKSKNDKEIYKSFHEINEYFSIIFHIVMDRFRFGNVNEINCFLQSLKKIEPDLYKKQSIAFNIINKYGYNSPQNTYKTFKALIRDLNLSNYVEIS